MKQRTVLISGAGVAGPTLAYWLARYGFRPTVVERSEGQRSSGNPVDVRGEAMDVAERMGVLPRLREAATTVSGLAFVNASGRRIGRIAVGRSGRQRARGAEGRPRRGHVRRRPRAGRVPVRRLHHGAAPGRGTAWTSPSTTGAPRRFDLVVGADGLHSAVRRLAVRPGLRLRAPPRACTSPRSSSGYAAADPSTVLMYNLPGRSVSVHPVNGNAMAAFIFRSPAIAGLDNRDTGGLQADRARRLPRRRLGTAAPARPGARRRRPVLRLRQPGPAAGLVPGAHRPARRRRVLHVALRQRVEPGHHRRRHARAGA